MTTTDANQAQAALGKKEIPGDGSLTTALQQEFLMEILAGKRTTDICLISLPRLPALVIE